MTFLDQVREYLKAEKIYKEGLYSLLIRDEIESEFSSMSMHMAPELARRLLIAVEALEFFSHWGAGEKATQALAQITAPMEGKE
jgi:hypothetical protein